MLTIPSLRGKLTSGSEGLGLAPAVLQTLSYTGLSHATSSMDSDMLYSSPCAKILLFHINALKMESAYCTTVSSLQMLLAEVCVPKCWYSPTGFFTVTVSLSWCKSLGCVNNSFYRLHPYATKWRKVTWTIYSHDSAKFTDSLRKNTAMALCGTACGAKIDSNGKKHKFISGGLWIRL